jgi:hypothetical protein
MLKSARVPEQAYAVVIWIVSLVFAGFLIGLGNLVIGDLPLVDQSVTQEQFVDRPALARIATERDQLTRRVAEIEDRLEIARLQRDQAQSASQTGAETFEAWIKTRTATTDPAQDPEVLARTRALEALKANERATQQTVDRLEAERIPLTQRQDALAARESEINAAGQPAFERAMFWQELRVFLWRLAFTLPLLVAAGWLVVKKRKSDYWPIMRGFVIAALFAFFVELVPYLPSYGGYIRYIVGIVLTGIAGVYAIRNMRAYLERRQAAEKVAEQERRALVSHDEAFKKMAAKVCPGCDRPIATTGEAEANFCVHCGMTLYNHCPACETRKMAFFRYCMTCGVPAKEEVAAA